MRDLRAACATVAACSRYVRIDRTAVAPYGRSLASFAAAPAPDTEAHLVTGSREELAAFWLTLDAINFGSGWFPTLRKPGGRSGYFTIATGLRRRFESGGLWSARELAAIDAPEIASVLEQAPDHELMALFATSLSDLGRQIDRHHGGRFAAVIDRAGASAVAFARTLGGWRCFGDTSTYEGIRIPFLKRAQIAAADVSRSGAAEFTDLGELTMFADNLVPHVLRLDGVLRFSSELVGRIEREQLIAHGSPEEVEIRACAVHAIELIAAELPGSSAIEIDQLLWHRGQQPRYKSSPRHRSRTTAY